MQKSDAEESNAKCHLCGLGLTYLEHMFYGNRCVFCAAQGRPIVNISKGVFLLRCYYDWRIYQVICQLIDWRGEDDAKMCLLGALGVMGYTDINRVGTVPEKWRLLRELKGLVKIAK